MHPKVGLSWTGTGVTGVCCDERVPEVVVFDTGLVAVIVDGTAVAERASCVNNDGLRGHRRAERACEATGYVLDDRELVFCLGDVSLHVVNGVFFVGVDCDKGGLFLCREFGV